MEGKTKKQMTCFDADDISDSLFQILRLGKEEKIDGDVTGHNLMPSLLHISVVKLLTALWNHAIVRNRIITSFPIVFNYQDVLPRWEKIEQLVLAKVAELPLPESICNQLVDAVRPIGKTIFEWIQYQDQHIYYTLHTKRSVAVHYMCDLVWTPRGRVDYAETAKVLVSKDGFSDETRYRIACTYCLEDDIVAIAPMVLSTRYLQKLEAGRYYTCDSRTMTSFWTRQLTKKPSMRTILPTSVFSELQNLTPISVSCLISNCISLYQNPVAIRYVWQQLSNEEKTSYVVPAIRSSYDVDLMFFLLQGSLEQRRELFKKCVGFLLSRIIKDWLWKDYFLPTVNLMWADMDGDMYLCLLGHLSYEVEQKSGQRYPNLQGKRMFTVFWKNSPDRLKQFAFEHDKGKSFIQIVVRVFCRETTNTIELMLSSASRELKRQIIHSQQGIKKCALLITSDEWDLLEIFIACTLSCEDYIDKLKKMVARQVGDDICVRFVERNELDKFHRFLGWCYKSREGRDEFMRVMACKTNFMICYLLLKSFHTYNGDFREADNFLRCFFSIQGVKEFKSNILRKQMEEHKIVQWICFLLFEEKFVVVEKTLNWCFSDDRQKINCFKNNFYGGIYDKCLQRLILALIQNDDGLQSLNKFFHSWFAYEGGRSHFIEKVISQQNLYLWEVLDLCDSSLKADFIEWCKIIVNDEEEIFV